MRVLDTLPNAIKFPLTGLIIASAVIVALGAFAIAVVGTIYLGIWLYHALPAAALWTIVLVPIAYFILYHLGKDFS